MRVRSLALLALASGSWAGCSGSGSSDSCLNVVCNSPPANSCKDESTQIRYESTGTCLPATGE